MVVIPTALAPASRSVRTHRACRFAPAVPPFPPVRLNAGDPNPHRRPSISNISFTTNFTFFNDFGIFMVATIAFSIVFALVLFIALVTEFGPTRDEDGVSTGDIRPLLLKMGVVKEKDAGRVAPEPAP